jgi:hypothetical protein
MEAEWTAIVFGFEVVRIRERRHQGDLSRKELSGVPRQGSGPAWPSPRHWTLARATTTGMMGAATSFSDLTINIQGKN